MKDQELFVPLVFLALGFSRKLSSNGTNIQIVSYIKTKSSPGSAIEQFVTQIKHNVMRPFKSMNRSLSTGKATTLLPVNPSETHVYSTKHRTGKLDPEQHEVAG